LTALKRIAATLLLSLTFICITISALAAQKPAPAQTPAPTPLPTYLPAEELEKLRALGEKGDLDTQFRLFRIYGEGKEAPMNMAESAKWAQKSAELGNEYAQVTTAALYGIGMGFQPDVAKAEKLLRKAAQKGSPLGEAGLGYLYFNGVGVPLDFKEAFKWFEKAANKGNPVGHAGLGKVYADGLDKPKDVIKGYMWYEVSAALLKEAKAAKPKGGWEDVVPILYSRAMVLDQVNSLKNLAGKEMSQAQIDKAKKLAADWLKKNKK
jgi:TPR repeat protein